MWEQVSSLAGILWEQSFWCVIPAGDRAAQAPELTVPEYPKH